MTTREQAMNWWQSISPFEEVGSRFDFADKYYPTRGHNNLTGREIEEIWRKENKTEVKSDLNTLIDNIIEDSQDRLSEIRLNSFEFKSGRENRRERRKQERKNR